MKKKFLIALITFVVIIGGYLLIKGSGDDGQPLVLMPRNDLQNEIAYSENTDLINGNYRIENGATITWSAQNSLRSHIGTVTLNSGTVTVLDNNVTGSFSADIESITSNGGELLNNHLRSEDFFDASRYPTADLLITGYINEGFQGELTIKETTLPVSLNGSITQVSDRELVINFSDTFDRSLWDVRYGSTSFFDDLGDSAIDDNIAISGDLRLYEN